MLPVFDQRELLIGKSVSLHLPASCLKYNIIGLEYFLLTILLARLRFEKKFKTIVDSKWKTMLFEMKNNLI